MTAKKTTENLPALENYQHQASDLLALCDGRFLNFQDDLKAFWQAWLKLHINVLAAMLAQFNQTKELDNAADAKLVEAFLKKRNRLLSVFIQRLHEEKIFDSTRQTFASIMCQHDEIFRHILQSAQNEMRRELKKAFAASAAVKGYAKSSTFGG